MDIAILGAGPSGIIAAWACLQYGDHPVLFDKGADWGGPGNNHGVFYLHSACDIPVRPMVIQNCILGSNLHSREKLVAMYAKKVYGNAEQPVSLDGLKVSSLGYPAAPVLAFIRRFLDAPVPAVVDRSYLEVCVQDAPTISTIPLSIYRPENVTMDYQTVVVEQFEAEDQAVADICVYNPLPAGDWYRFSKIGHQACFEYVHLSTECPGAIEVKKVASCSHKPEELPMALGLGNAPVLFTGRFGAWDKSCLTHSVYERTMAWLYRLHHQQD